MTITTKCPDCQREITITNVHFCGKASKKHMAEEGQRLAIWAHKKIGQCSKEENV